MNNDATKHETYSVVSKLRYTIILSLSYGSRFDVLLFGLEMFMLPQLLLSLQSGKLKNLFFQTVFPFRG